MGNNGSIITHYRPPQLGDASWSTTHWYSGLTTVLPVLHFLLAKISPFDFKSMIYSSRLISSEQIQKVDFEIFDFRALLLLKIICLCLITTRNTSGGNFRSRMHNIIVLLYRREQNRSTAFCRMREVKIALSLTKNIGQTLSSCKDWQFLPARGDNSDQIVAWLI